LAASLPKDTVLVEGYEVAIGVVARAESGAAREASRRRVRPSVLVMVAAEEASAAAAAAAMPEFKTAA
ncbi:hypothetical protein KEM52_003753, partial [Ascosphaera acerosa]